MINKKHLYFLMHDSSLLLLVILYYQSLNTKICAVFRPLHDRLLAHAAHAWPRDLNIGGRVIFGYRLLSVLLYLYEDR
jgi:hypothetical protein